MQRPGTGFPKLTEVSISLPHKEHLNFARVAFFIIVILAPNTLANETFC